MEKISKLQRIMVESTNEIYLKPEKDFPFGEPKWFKIVDGRYVKALFANKKLICVSNDSIHGRRTNDNLKRACVGCEDEEVCTTSCRLYMENLIPGNLYLLNIPRAGQVALSQYVDRLLINGLDAPYVYTKITRMKSGKYATYTFELACDDFTEEELNKITSIIKTYSILPDDELEDFDIESLLKVSGIDTKRIPDIMNLIKV